MPAYFPLFVNLSEKKFVVFGAGKIAARRVSGLLRYGAAVTVIAPKTGADMRALLSGNPGRLLIKERAYLPGELKHQQADYVLAATDNSKVNAAIVQECRNRKIPVNNASDSTQCDFYFPALVERDQLVVGVVSTDGNHKKTARFCKRLRSLEGLADEEE